MTEGKCPVCGAPVAFSAGSASVLVCGSCNAVVARTDRGLESDSKVAVLVDTDSPLQVGLHGAWEGRGFRVTGRLQRSNGSSTWDEWAVYFDDGQDGWLSESEGTWRLMFEGKASPVKVEEAKPDSGLVVGGRLFVVEEVGVAEVVSGEGELPHGFVPGVAAAFVEATAADGRCAYVEKLPGGEQAQVFFGQELPLSALGLDLSGRPPPRRQVRLSDARCTECNAPLEFHAPELAQRVACAYCGALLDCSTGRLKLLEQLSKPKPTPIPLGRKGTLMGVEWTVLARLRRSCEVDGLRYGWSEYLLWQREVGFRWLMESNGHWTFLEPLAAGAVGGTKVLSAEYQGRTYKLFQEVTTRTDSVTGECYWQVAEGDSTKAAEFVAPPHALNRERTDSEVSWTFSTYLTQEQVAGAFSPKPLFGPEGIAPSQPNPVTPEQLRNGLWALAACVLVLCLHMALASRAPDTSLYRHTWKPAAAPASPESMVFSEPFKLDRPGKLQVEGWAMGMDNSWASLEVDLVDGENQVTAASFESEHYSGVDDEGNWVEASSTGSEVFPVMPAGTYQVRLVPNWEVGKPPPQFSVVVAATGPRFLWVFWAWVLLLAAPLVQRVRHSMFESARWAESNTGYAR